MSTPTFTPAPLPAPADAGFAERVRASFARQGAMATIGAQLADVQAGRVLISLPLADHVTQQHGFLHGGLLAAVLLIQVELLLEEQLTPQEDRVVEEYLDLETVETVLPIH